MKRKKVKEVVQVKHFGDITKISGYTAPMVDVIIGGSPCQGQDLSVAGKRKGLDGERSGLFMEQVRIAKEMRKRDEKVVYSFKKLGEKKENGWCSWEIWRIQGRIFIF